MKVFDYVVVGAGIVGAAVAAALTAARRGTVLVLERENLPGTHSSGRNAAMIRRILADPVTAELSRRGADFIANRTPAWRRPPEFARHGSLLTGGRKDLDAHRPAAEAARSEGLPVEELSPAEAAAMHPLLAGSPIDGAWHCPADGWVDAAGYLLGFLAEAEARGAEIRMGCPLRGIQRASGTGFVVETEQEFVVANVIVNAAGAWAGDLGRMAGTPRLPLVPHRRHLFLTPSHPGADAAWPFVWDLTGDLYFRPHGSGLMFCPCDEERHGPGTPKAAPEAEEMLRRKLAAHFPLLADVPLSHGRAGLRTLTPDGRAVLGWDARVPGFFWAAGFGGHGITASGAAGELAAALLTGKSDPLAGPLMPGRFTMTKKDG